jgi:hypothetical protein
VKRINQWPAGVGKVPSALASAAAAANAGAAVAGNTSAYGKTKKVIAYRLNQPYKKTGASAGATASANAVGRREIARRYRLSLIKNRIPPPPPPPRLKNSMASRDKRLRSLDLELKGKMTKKRISDDEAEEDWHEKNAATVVPGGSGGSSSSSKRKKLNVGEKQKRAGVENDPNERPKQAVKKRW